MNYRRLFIVALIGGLLAHGALAVIKKPSIKNIDSPGSNIIAFGDSLVYGIGASEVGKTDMFSLVARDLNIPIINKGVPGNTTADALERIDQDVLQQDPRIVFILLGGNDYLQKKSKEETFGNLRVIIKRIQEKGAAVILVGVRGGLVDKFAGDYEKIAEEYETGYVPDVLEGIILNRKLMYDSIHPNDRGYEIIALRITSVLEKVLAGE